MPNEITLDHAAKEMVGELIEHALGNGVDLSGITVENFNNELDSRFNDGGIARCERFADHGWDYAGQFGQLATPNFEKALWDAIVVALDILPSEWEKRKPKKGSV